jgi:hypothetical protein
MEPQDNKQLALQKAVSAHQQAEAALADLMSALAGDRYEAMLSRIRDNIADLEAEASTSSPGDIV